MSFINRYICFSNESLKEMSWVSTFLSGCSLIISGITLILTNVVFLAILSFAIGVMVCALSGAVYYAGKLTEEHEKSR
ncbi:hypothetical protein EIV80_19655 [Salmonella enterica]|nr:hypothetical protein [Salmonella enterica]